MAWETRNGRGRYYTRSRRVDGRVVREYIGCGPAAKLAAMYDEMKRAERDAEREAWCARKQELERIERLLARSWEGCWEQASHALTDAGFYRHHRGEWRKRRGKQD